MDRASSDRLPGLTKARLTRRGALMTAGAGIMTAAGKGPWIGRAAAQESTPTAGSEGTPAAEPIEMTGQAVPELAGFDEAVLQLMPKWNVPGGQVAVAKDGKLVFNRGYGWADVENKLPVQPDALFRIASVSKTVTATAIMKLIEDGKLTLATKAFPVMGLQPAANATIDPRLETITVEQLLVHSGGFDSSTGFDPQFLPFSRMAAGTMGLEDPPEAETIVRWMQGVSLDFDPGTKSVYSNFGFNVLGRVIERASGQPYGEYVRDHLLTPAGISGMELGRTRREFRAPKEVVYYSPEGVGLRDSVFWGEGYVPVAYGSYYQEALDAHGGYIASAADLVRFTLSVDGQRGNALLSPSTVKVMIETPRPKESGTGSGWNNQPVPAGLGWDVFPVEGGVEWSHGGALEGTAAAWPLHGVDGLTMGFTFNTLPQPFRKFFLEAGEALQAAASAVKTWPTHDLFS
jgi:CubicO group peptidase (beta-lactamase class C family)